MLDSILVNPTNLLILFFSLYFVYKNKCFSIFNYQVNAHTIFVFDDVNHNNNYLLQLVLSTILKYGPKIIEYQFQHLSFQEDFIDYLIEYQTEVQARRDQLI